MEKRGIVLLLDYPSESEPEVEVDSPRPKRRRIPTDRLVDHPAEPTIHRQRSQATNLTSNPTTTEVELSSTIDTAKTTDMLIHPHDPVRAETEHLTTARETHVRITNSHDTQSPAGNSNTVSEPDMLIYPHDPSRIDTEHLITVRETHVRITNPHDTQSPAGNNNNTARETYVRIPNHDTQSPAKKSNNSNRCEREVDMLIYPHDTSHTDMEHLGTERSWAC